MSLRNCINDAEADGSITKEQADRARDLFGERYKQYLEVMGDAQAASKAAGDTFDALKFEAMERKRRKSLQIKTWARLQYGLDNYRNLKNEEDYGRAALAFFEQDQTSSKYFLSVTQLQNTIERQATSMIPEMLAKHRRNIVGGVRKKADLEDMTREVFEPGSTGNASAAEFADAWRNVSEYLRKRANAAGASIVKRLDWGMPQVHNSMAVRAVSKAEWVEFTRELIDYNKMIDETTQLPYTKQSIDMALEAAYETIATEGFSKLKPGSVGVKSKASKRTDHRFLVFKNADAWIEYQKRFGSENSFDTMISHISAMARDIAQMEVLGPNPVASVKFLQDSIQKRAFEKGGEAEINKAGSYADRVGVLYDTVNNTLNAPVNGRVASTLAGTRQVLQSAQLGMASVAAITDVNFQRMARAISGLPQANLIKDYLKQLSPLNQAEKGKLAIRLGLIAEGWTSVAATQARYVGDISGPEITRRIADTVMRVSLLSPMTTAGRWSFGMEFLGTLGDNAGKAFNDLDPNLRGAMERYGISDQDWDVIRATPLYEDSGAQFLRGMDIEARTDLNPDRARALANKVISMVETETNRAIPSVSERGRSVLIDRTKPGTFAGELLRSGAMYKNFGVSLFMNNIMFGMTKKGKGRASYFADLIISTTLMGALALQLKEMGKGRDPRPMEGPEFWTAAILQGGGFGIFGDFLFSDVNRFGKSLGETMAGPVVGLGSDIIRLAAGNLQEAAYGEDTNFAGEAVRMISRYAPGTSLWYARLAMERLIFDQIQLMVDPKYQSKIRRVQTKYRREYGQDYWWRPGETEPDRGPDLESAIKTAP